MSPQGAALMVELAIFHLLCLAFVIESMRRAPLVD